MKVFKFGGASVKDTDAIRNIASVLQSYQGEPLMIVVSAMGKTTNALENVAELYYKNDRDAALEAFSQIKNAHYATAESLLDADALGLNKTQLNDLFTEVEWLLYDEPVREYAYYYDQIVCLGELLSTTIIHAYLVQSQLANEWLDIRDVLRTNDIFREAMIDWDYSQMQMNAVVKPKFEQGKWVVTQGFIGCTDENESTTLGREGSDFTAAVVAHLLDAESVTIWKDVEGVMNADPKIFPSAEYIPHLNYAEVIEMAYYGAQIIHPKTIKPIQNKQIPLYVKCFLDKNLPGTVIDGNPVDGLPPIIILKKNQVAYRFKTTDFSFVSGKPLLHLHEQLSQLGMRPNMMQVGAIKLIICLDNRPDRNKAIVDNILAYFGLEQITESLELLTIRHYNDVLIESLTKDLRPFLIQQTEKTIQVLYHQ